MPSFASGGIFHVLSAMPTRVEARLERVLLAAAEMLDLRRWAEAPERAGKRNPVPVAAAREVLHADGFAGAEERAVENGVQRQPSAAALDSSRRLKFHGCMPSFQLGVA